MSFFIGSDPEFMLVNKNDEFVSAIPVVGHSKDNRLDLGGGNKMFYDNVLLEFNIKPAPSGEDFVENLHKCFRASIKHLRGYRLRPQASQIYPKESLNCNEAIEFGCEPEFCAYELEKLPSPICDPNDSMRSAGGHIHLGSKDNPNLLDSMGKNRVIRMMDVFVGVPSVILDNDPTSKARRSLYGKAGSMRPKSYGAEYRSMGNFWVASPRLTRLIHQLSRFAANFDYTRLWREEPLYDVQLVRSTIDNADKDKAYKITEDIVKRYVPTALYKEIHLAAAAKTVDFYKEWQLKS